MISETLSLVLLLTALPVHGSGGKRIAQPPVIEKEYETHVQWGQGFDLQAFDWRSTPFDFTEEMEIAEEPATLSTEYKKEVVKSQSEMSEAMRATASVSFEGYGAKVKADFSYDSSSSFSASDALFIMHAEKQFGFKGWKRPPGFTEQAKKTLCKRFGTDADDSCQEYTVCETGACSGERAPTGWFDHGSCCKETRQEKAIRHENWRLTDGRTPGFTSNDVYEPCGKSSARVDYEAFQELYGTHYVSGDRYAVSLDVYVKLSTQTTNSEQKIDASLEASFSGYGVEGGGSASFEMGISSKAQEERVTIWAESKGTHKSFLPNVDPQNLDNIVDEWKNVSDVGTGMAHVMHRYDDHPEYHEVVANCKVEGDIFQPEDQWKNKCVDVAIWNKLVADDIIERQPTDCARNEVATPAYEEYERLLNLAEDEFTREEYLESLRRTEDLVGTWDALANTCKQESQWCEYQFWEAERELEEVQRDIEDSKKACDENAQCKAIVCDKDGNVCTLRGEARLKPSKTRQITYVKAKYCKDFGEYFKEGSCLTKVEEGDSPLPNGGGSSGRVDLGDVDNITACMGLCLKSDPFTACSFEMGNDTTGKGKCYRETHPITGRALDDKSRCLYLANNLQHAGENCGDYWACYAEGRKDEYCNWCGSGKCCRKGDEWESDACQSWEGADGFHSCIPATWEWEDDVWDGQRVRDVPYSRDRRRIELGTPVKARLDRQSRQ